MKITSISLVLCISALFASNTHSQTARVSVHTNKAQAKEIIDLIEAQTDYLFVYNNNIDLPQDISMDVKNTSVAEVLAYVFSDSDIVYAMEGNNILLLKKKEIFVQQQNVRPVNGTVMDQFGEPVIGANIVVKGTTNGVISDYNGKFSIQTESNSVLIISYIGYISLDIPVNSQTNLTIVLREDSQRLEEVVVVGYGVQRKSDLTGSISSVTAEDILSRPQFNALEGLKGKAAGVNILSSTGNPLGLEGQGARVIIRGMNSINTSSDPLYVVDGVQMVDFHYLNPNDIERIEVLKDASSTAIYGARGANGVILVTTKRGNAGEGRTTVSYNGYVSLGTMAKKIDLMNAAEFLEMEDYAFATLSNTPAGQKTLDNRGLTEWVPRRTDPLFFDANGNPLYDTDWQDEVTRTAISHNHQLSIQHQSQKSSVGAFLIMQIRKVSC
ncbi:MAG: TonB-dependent receptor plug domain-containing protein [Tannerellaceae bacterium]|nr:TonB-dependent receptor plug domain-containing protein [Tannerellaceae bacterium]